MRSADVVTRSILLDPWDPSLTYPVDLSHDGWNWLYDDNTTVTLAFPVVRYISDISPYEAGEPDLQHSHRISAQTVDAYPLEH